MKEFFGPSPYNDLVFSIGDIGHLIILGVVFIMTLITIIKRKSLNSIKSKQFVRVTLGVLLLALMGTRFVWLYVNNLDSLTNALPLHLCEIATFLMGIALVFNVKKIIYLMFFWSIAGGVEALLLPQYGNYGFNHFRFYQFFLDHFLLYYIPLLLIVVFNFKLSYKQLWMSYLLLVTVGVGVLFVNVALDVNYMMLNKQPDLFTTLNLFSNQTTYVLFLAAAQLVVFHIAYLLLKPFTRST